MRRRDDPAPTTTAEDTAGPAAALAELGARGELVLFADGCGVRRLALPALSARDSTSCRPRGALSPDRRLVATCVDDGVEVRRSTDARLAQLLPGCTPAWRPDGTMTAALGDEVVRFRPCASRQPCRVTLIPRRELQRAARRHRAVPDGLIRLRALVDGIAWISDRRAAVSLSIRLGGRFEGLGPLGTVAFFDGGRLTRVPQYFRLTGGRLAASPRGTYVTQTPDVILRRDGSVVTLPEHLRDVRDFAWSPNERLLALATRFAVEVVDVTTLERYDRTGSGLRSVTLPQAAVRLAWR